jgi:endonuclease/exonuclease/phosphatase (EEP) superfamily protein YafD
MRRAPRSREAGAPPASRDLVVPCQGPGHRVRLRGGFRFFASARCPRCRARVDPLRVRRLACLITNLRRPRSDAPSDRLLWALSLAALVGSIGAAVLLWGFGDVWWPATVLLFSGRWPFLLPLIPISAWATLQDRSLLAPLVVAMLVVIGPIMGFRTGWRSTLRLEKDSDLRVASFNVAGGGRLRESPATLLEEWGVQVAAFQECGAAFRSQLRAVQGWNTHEGGSLCFSSRYPIIEARKMDREVLASVGGSALVYTYVLETPKGLLHVTNVHLETPREGLALIRSGRIAAGIPVLREKMRIREIEHRRAQRQAAEAGPPGIVLGDFNTPPESRVLRREWSDWANTFSVAGFGFGGTRLNGWIKARIDHILVDRSWTVVDAWLGEDAGSDHRPIIARIRY